MFKSLNDWLFHRALRLSHATTVAIAKFTKQSPESIQALNDAGAAFVVGQADQAASNVIVGK